MIQIEQKKDCCGCSACAEKCPQQCIQMKEDKEGFLYPSIQQELCIDCGLCEKVCPILQKPILFHEDKEKIPLTIGGWHKDDSIRSDSSSGGAFSLFANYILGEGGIIYGAAMDESLQVKHIGIEKVEDLRKLRGSKYVQSCMGNIYSQVEANLKANRKILFSGTPCQAAGLHSYLKKEYENLYIIDFICHGVPSPKVFSSYVQYLEEKYKDTIITFKFRMKDRNWNPSGLQLGTGIGTGTGRFFRRFPGFMDFYMNGFLDDVYLRPSCYNCQFKSLPKYYSDITIADFWGVSKIDRDLYDGKGTSLILINSKRGAELFKKTKKDFYYKECNFEQSIRRNQSLIRSASWNPRRDKFFRDYENKPFRTVMLKHMSPFSWGFHKVVKISWNLFEGILKKIAKMFLTAVHIQWSETRWENWVQFIRFSMVGVTNVFVSYTINITSLSLLRKSHLTYDYVIANISAFLLSVLWSYYWNSRLVFTISQGENRSKIQTLLKTYAAYAFSGLILNNLLSTFWIHVIHVSKYISPLLNLPITIPINYFIIKFWAYKKEKDKT